MARTRVKFAKYTASVREVGSKYPTSVKKGSAWHADHPIVASHPEMFDDDPPEVLPRGWKPSQVEQATAAPGEKRAATRPPHG